MVSGLVQILLLTINHVPGRTSLLCRSRKKKFPCVAFLTIVLFSTGWTPRELARYPTSELAFPLLIRLLYCNTSPCEVLDYYYFIRTEGFCHHHERGQFIHAWREWSVRESSLGYLIRLRRMALHYVGIGSQALAGQSKPICTIDLGKGLSKLST